MNLKVSSTIELESLQLSHAKDIFDTIDSQRTYLGEWLPFVEHTKGVKDIEEFLNFVIQKPKEKLEYAFAIKKEGNLVGLIDMKQTDVNNGKTELGYWLSEKCQGEGIMTASVKKICEFAFEELNLNRVQIKCAVGNLPSKNIPKRLGFVFEGIERAGEKFSDHTFIDLEIYSKLKSDR